MKLTRRRFAGTALAVAGVRPQVMTPLPDDTVHIAQLVDVSGAAALVGDAWRNGVEMAVQEINAAGGLGGRLVQVTSYDGQSSPAVAKTATQRALEGAPSALLGPVAAASVRAAAPVVKAAHLAWFVGADASDITSLDVPGLFRVSLATNLCIARLAGWMHDGLPARRIAVLWENTEPGRAARGIFLKEARARGLEPGNDIPLPAAPAEPFPDLAPVTQSSADGAFLAVSEENAARVLTAARRQLTGIPFFGGSALVAPQVLRAAGPAAEGMRAILDLTPDAPEVSDFRASYLARYKEAPDRNAMLGYIALGAVKAASDRTGRTEPAALAEALRGVTISAATEPGILLDTKWDASGEPDRACFLAEVRGGKPVVVQTLAPAHA
jgi:branched-chain amino acid transport system substrate-binding protein